MPRVLVLLLLVGCSDAAKEHDAGASGPSNPSGEAGAASGGSTGGGDSCRDDCETFARCQGFPASGCAGEIHCGGWPATLWRAEVLAAYQACQDGCPADPEACSMAAFTAAGAPRAIDMQYATLCEAKDAECDLVNYACGEESLYVESAVQSGIDCLSQAGCAVEGCLNTAFARDVPSEP